jgi:hypothetical protein
MIFPPKAWEARDLERLMGLAYALLPTMEPRWRDAGTIRQDTIAAGRGGRTPTLQYCLEVARGDYAAFLRLPVFPTLALAEWLAHRHCEINLCNPRSPRPSAFKASASWLCRRCSTMPRCRGFWGTGDVMTPDLYDGAFRDLLTRINPSAPPGRACSFSSLTLDATRKDRLVHISREPTMRQWVLDYVIGMLDRRSHQERHFMYLALGVLGGAAAKRAVKSGLDDRDDFARLGAEKAWRLLNRRG